MLTSGLNIISQTMPTRPLTAAKTATGSCATWRGYCDGIFSKLSSDIRDGAKLRCPLCARSGHSTLLLLRQNQYATTIQAGCWDNHKKEIPFTVCNSFVAKRFSVHFNYFYKNIIHPFIDWLTVCRT